MGNSHQSQVPFFDVLLEASEQFRNGIILLNMADRKITYANDKATELLGSLSNLSPEQENNFLSCVDTQHRDYVQARIESLLRQKRAGEIEFRYHHPQTSQATQLCCSLYFLNRSNQLFIHVADITQTKAQENFLTEFGTKKNTLIETMTHHFSGALMLMQELTGQAEQAMTRSGDHQLTQYLKLLSANTASCVAMMNSLLNEEHLKSTDIAVKKFHVDVVEKAAFIYENLLRAFPNRLITYDTVAPSIFAYTDEFKVLQIINNFVSNAIKFTLPEKQIALSIYQTERNIIISVEDEGIGIPDRLRPFLFKKKSEAGREGLAGERTNGYGLYISKMLAEAMHATIEYETEEGKGSIFYLLIPQETGATIV